MNRSRIVILLVVKSFFSLIALVLLTIVIHEGAHYITALIMKVPIASFTWFDPRYLCFPVTITAERTAYFLRVAVAITILLDG